MLSSWWEEEREGKRRRGGIYERGKTKAGPINVRNGTSKRGELRLRERCERGSVSGRPRRLDSMHKNETGKEGIII